MIVSLVVTGSNVPYIPPIVHCIPVIPHVVSILVDVRLIVSQRPGSKTKLQLL